MDGWVDERKDREGKKTAGWRLGDPGLCRSALEVCVCATRVQASV